MADQSISEYLAQLRESAKSWVADLDVDAWMNEIRDYEGEDDAADIHS